MYPVARLSPMRRGGDSFQNISVTDCVSLTPFLSQTYNAGLAPTIPLAG
jgi:hypothetical protein